MKRINGISDLKNEIKSSENVWLLLYKNGSEQSNCALDNYSALSEDEIAGKCCLADVNEVKDIHSEYGVTSVPALLQFENGILKNIVKGCQTNQQYKSIIENTVVTGLNSQTGKQAKNVVVYTTPTCSWCTVVKRYLKETGIQYREINVAADQKAAEEMVRKSGQQGVPQTDINGQIVVGFDKARINTLLGLN